MAAQRELPVPTQMLRQVPAADLGDIGRPWCSSASGGRDPSLRLSAAASDERALEDWLLDRNRHGATAR